MSRNPQSVLGCRYYYHSHFLFKEALGLRQVKHLAGLDHPAPEYAPHDLTGPLALLYC